jgi:hypothetical protein
MAHLRWLPFALVHCIDGCWREYSQTRFGCSHGLINSKTGNLQCDRYIGDDDHLGDMDFKVTGTRDGICGVQMDIKVDGLSMDVMRQALAQANKAACTSSMPCIYYLRGKD